MNRPRVLLIAEAANPEFVSVPLVGWSLATALRAETRAHVVTQVRNRAAFLRAGLTEGVDFTAIDSERVARPVYRLGQRLRMGQNKGWTTMMALSALSYAYFERLLWRRFGPEIEAGAYDLVHRITPLSPTIPSRIAPRCAAAGVPFVLGPLNGGLPWPPGFDAERRREREWLSYVRGAYKALPGRGRTLDAAAAIIVGSRHTLSEIPARNRDKCVYIPENAIDPDRFGAPPKRGVSRPLRGCFVGRLVPYKCPDLLIRAAAPLMRAGRFALDIVGDGPMTGDLQALAATLGVSQCVRFHGFVPHTAVTSILGAADVFAFPSVREFGGAVVLEAMALGVVPIVVDYGGPGEHVTPETGFAIPIGPRAQIERELRALLATVTTDPDSLAAKRAAGIARIADKYTWARKAAQVADVYRWARGLSPDRPDPFRT